MLRKNVYLRILVPIAILIVISILSFAFGSKTISLSEGISYFTDSESLDRITYAILSKRVVRTFFGIVIGASLSLSGVLMQQVVNNSIADPSLLGVNTGASLFIVIGLIVFKINTVEHYIYLSILGAAFTSLFVYLLSFIGKDKLSAMRLLMSGAAVNIAFSSLLSILLVPADNIVLDSYRFWQIGNIGGASLDNILLLLPFFAIGFLMTFILKNSLNTLALGDEMAMSLGVNILFIRLFASLASVILVGASTALAGPIAFIGLMVPHLVRIFSSESESHFYILVCILGASLLVFSDIIGRLIQYPGELEVGIITALIGSPIFIYLIRKKQ